MPSVLCLAASVCVCLCIESCRCALRGRSVVPLFRSAAEQLVEEAGVDALDLLAKALAKISVSPRYTEGLPTAPDPGRPGQWTVYSSMRVTLKHAGVRMHRVCVVRSLEAGSVSRPCFLPQGNSDMKRRSLLTAHDDATTLHFKAPFTQLRTPT